MKALWHWLQHLVGMATAPLRRRLFAARHRRAVQQQLQRGGIDDLPRAQQVDRLAAKADTRRGDL